MPYLIIHYLNICDYLLSLFQVAFDIPDTCWYDFPSEIHIAGLFQVPLEGPDTYWHDSSSALHSAGWGMNFVAVWFQIVFQNAVNWHKLNS